MERQQSNFSLALLIFIAVFGITNIPNNYAAIGGQTISWFILLALYFIPMALIMAELSSYDSNTTSGISRWVEVGTTRKIAFFCGWAYFVENIFYLPMLASRVPVFLSWVFAPIPSMQEVVDKNGALPGVITATDAPTLFLALAFITVIIGVFVAFNFEELFEKLGKYIGAIALVIAFSFIILSVSSIFVMHQAPAYPLTIDNVKPTLSPNVVSTLVWIIFAIGGVETIGSIVNKVDNPNKRLPKIVTIGAILTILAYVIGTLGMTFIMTPDQLSPDALENAIPVMFAGVLSAYGLNGIVGVIFFKFIMLGEVFLTITALVLWYVATINVLFADNRKGIFPAVLEKRDKKGRPVNGMYLTLGLILLFLIMTNMSAFSNVYYVLYDMSTISVVVPFILLLISYINFKRKGLKGGYTFVKSNLVGMIIGILLLVITSLAFIFGVVDLPSIVAKDYSTAINWFMISFGGLLLFMLIGWIIYKEK